MFRGRYQPAMLYLMQSGISNNEILMTPSLRTAFTIRIVAAREEWNLILRVSKALGIFPCQKREVFSLGSIYQVLMEN